MNEFRSELIINNQLNNTKAWYFGGNRVIGSFVPNVMF